MFTQNFGLFILGALHASRRSEGQAASSKEVFDW
jgi:hypothetical protein